MCKFPSFCQAIGEASKRLNGQGTLMVDAQGKECPSGFLDGQCSCTPSGSLEHTLTHMLMTGIHHTCGGRGGG